MGTSEQASECEGVFPMFRLVASCQYVLNLIEEMRWDQRLVGSLVLNSLPDEVPEVKAVLQNLLEVRTGQPVIQPRWWDLFDDDERKEARMRLKKRARPADHRCEAEDCPLRQSLTR